jgi:hypothetical protein
VSEETVNSPVETVKREEEEENCILIVGEAVPVTEVETTPILIPPVSTTVPLPTE